MDETKPLPPAPCFGPRGWYELDPDPLDAVVEEGGDWDEGFKTLGFEPWTRIGMPEWPSVPFAFTVHRRDTGKPRFKVQIETSRGQVFEYVYADDLPSVMRLLGEWAPAAQAAVMLQVASMFPTGRRVDELPELAGLLRAVGMDGLEKVADKVDDVRRAVDFVHEQLESVESGLERDLGNIANAVG